MSSIFFIFILKYFSLSSPKAAQFLTLESEVCTLDCVWWSIKIFFFRNLKIANKSDKNVATRGSFAGHVTLKKCKKISLFYCNKFFSHQDIFFLGIWMDFLNLYLCFVVVLCRLRCSLKSVNYYKTDLKGVVINSHSCSIYMREYLSSA